MYVVQQQAEWSGPEFADCIDLDFEFDTEEEARRFIAKELPKGITYVLTSYDDSINIYEEGTA